MERIDKVIGNQMGYSRREIKELIRRGRVIVNSTVITKSDSKIDSNIDVIEIDGKIINIKKYIYLILNKPKGYVSATSDKRIPTVLDLVPSEYLHRNLFPVGRLDKDTTGLMIITDDGTFAHNILSPKKHVKKTYNVTIDIPVTDEMIIEFKNGVMLNDGMCKSALLEKTGKYSSLVTLTEGRYHQIKRMFGCFGAKVILLERIKIGNLSLPDNLEIGSCRELSTEELNRIQEK